MSKIILSRPAKAINLMRVRECVCLCVCASPQGLQISFSVWDARALGRTERRRRRRRRRARNPHKWGDCVASPWIEMHPPGEHTHKYARARPEPKKKKKNPTRSRPSRTHTIDQLIYALGSSQAILINARAPRWDEMKLALSLSLTVSAGTFAICTSFTACSRFVCGCDRHIHCVWAFISNYGLAIVPPPPAANSLVTKCLYYVWYFFRVYRTDQNAPIATTSISISNCARMPGTGRTWWDKELVFASAR